MKRRFGWRTLALILGLSIPLLAWVDISGNTINPDYVARIKDGQTTKNEIMLLFGEPQEVQRTQMGLVFTYQSYRDATMPAFTKEREINEQSTVPFFLDDKKTVKKVPVKKKGKILHSTLTVRFKPDDYTVDQHTYKVHDAKEKISVK
ncbi:MAG: hypothetical protein PHW74_04300 [Desulfobacca sp.]|nr:hypothetical protein [Desulfobacca sp.]